MPTLMITRTRPAGSAASRRKSGRISQRQIASLCFLLLVPLGCDGNSDATPPSTPTPTGSTSPTPSPTPSKPAPPTLPPAATGLTIESADAFTRFYLRLLDYGQLTGDVVPLTKWSDKGCIGCSDLIRDYTKVHMAGGSYSGDLAIANVVVSSVRLNQTKAAEIKFRASTGRHTVVERRGATPTVYPGESFQWTLTLAARGGQWIAYELEDEAG